MTATTPRRPTLLSSCAMAATAAEARYRIDGPEPTPRVSRIVALDPGAAEVVARVVARHDTHTHLLAYEAGTPVHHGNGPPGELVLRARDGRQVRLSDELADADMVVLVATSDDGADAASLIGEICLRRGIMTSGVVFGDNDRVPAAVTALRPYARVLLVSRDDDDVPELLSALRA